VPHGRQGQCRWTRHADLIPIAVERHADSDSGSGSVDIEAEATDNSPSVKASVVPTQAFEEVFLLRGEISDREELACTVVNPLQ
jgi:hypothetical protein